MKTNILKFLLLMILFSGSMLAQVTKKYDIKSAIITFDTVMKMGDMEIKQKNIVYFYDYGMKECKETYSDDKLEESFFSDGKDLYLSKYASKEAFKRGPASRGTELRVEWTEFGTEEDRQNGIYKKIPSITVSDRKCEMFEYNDGEGTVTQYGGWNRVLLFMDMKTSGMETLQKAVKVEENVKIAPEKFKVPAGFKIQ